MNNFTKYELIQLRTCVLWAYIEHDRELAAKLKSMIDNYDCDHFPVIKLDENYMPTGEKYCDKCGLELWRT